MPGHDNQRTGRTQDGPAAPFSTVWARQFPGEVIATRVEPIVAGGVVYVGTCSGRLHAVDGRSGADRWTDSLDGPILHSVSAYAGSVFAATAAGSVYRLDSRVGRPVWRARLGDFGFDTAPLVEGGLVVCGSRGGTLFAIDAAKGTIRWKRPVGAPIRTTAATDGKSVFVAVEDMRARGVDLRTGRALWTSEPLAGQSMRDYFPVVAGRAVIFRTNPAGPFADRLLEDRAVLLKSAGIPATDWRVLDAFLKSDRTRGTPEQIQREQQDIRRHLDDVPDARTFFVIDGSSGKPLPTPPVLYAAGCQGVGVPPALDRDGRALVLYRTAYSNWSLGVAPLIGIGVLDPVTGTIHPLKHESGSQPPWNAFWGTADETTRLATGGDTLFFTHQGTLGALNLSTRTLVPIAGARDTYAGYPAAWWARNEWHGPARGSAAISGDTLYWISGSRLVAVRGSASSPAKRPDLIPPAPTPALRSSVRAPMPGDQELDRIMFGGPLPAAAGRTNRPIAAELAREVREALDGPWKPLYVQPGLAGRELFFTHSSDVFEALSLAYPVLPEDLRGRVRAYLREQFTRFPPFSSTGGYPPGAGREREWFQVEDRFRASTTAPKPPSPLVWLYAVWLYASEIGEWQAVRDAWPQIRSNVAPLLRTAGARQGLWANREAAGMIAYARLARRFGDSDGPMAAEQARNALREIVSRMREFDEGAALRPPNGVSELDRFIGSGGALFTAIRPHKARIAYLYGITPEIAICVQRYAGSQYRALLDTIDRVMPCWYLAGEERQVHFGENFVDYPDQAADIFTAMLASGNSNPAHFADMPSCRADLYHIKKLALLMRSRAR